jgi:hypothetical protein
MFTEANPNAPLGANVQSREKIMELLASADGTRTYTDETGTAVECHPMSFFINELKNFLSINPTGMIEFLTDIYGQKYFRNSTLKHGEQIVPNPCVNILACETPEWIQDKLKMRILSGGWSRRMVYIYDLDARERIPFPEPTLEGIAARERCVNHLKSIKVLVGPFEWDPLAKEFFAKWYKELPVPDDPIMRGYYSSKQDQMLKLAMGLCLAERTPRLYLTVPHLEVSIATLDQIEDNLPKLSLAAGRNELAIPQQQLMELIETHGGWYPEKWVLRDSTQFLDPGEQYTVIRFLIETEQLYRGSAIYPLEGTVMRVMLCTKVKYLSAVREGHIKLPNK